MRSSSPVGTPAMASVNHSNQTSVMVQYAHYAWGYELTKRTSDIVLSVVALVLLSPLLLLTALAIKLDSPGPVLFVQTRVGRRGCTFRLFKFRSMCDGSEAKRAEMASLNELSGPVFKMKQDPRITRVGRAIRKLSIDELPQLINVILGDMSLVGPRPPLPAEVAQYTEYQSLRLLVKPGLTCYWQVSGRSDLDFDQWVELDLRYIRERGLLTDLKLLLMTIPAVISCKGAY